MTPLIDPKHLATLREMSDAYQRGQVPRWSRANALALEYAVAALESAQELWSDYAQLNELIGQERRVYAELLDVARKQGAAEAQRAAAQFFLASLPENTREVADDQP